MGGTHHAVTSECGPRYQLYAIIASHLISKGSMVSVNLAQSQLSENGQSHRGLLFQVAVCELGSVHGATSLEVLLVSVATSSK